MKNNVRNYNDLTELAKEQLKVIKPYINKWNKMIINYEAIDGNMTKQADSKQAFINNVKDCKLIEDCLIYYLGEQNPVKIVEARLKYISQLRQDASMATLYYDLALLRNKLIEIRTNKV